MMIAKLIIMGITLKVGMDIINEMSYDIMLLECERAHNPRKRLSVFLAHPILYLKHDGKRTGISGLKGWEMMV